MKLGLGLGFSPPAAGQTQLSDIIISLIGQSLHDHLVTQHSGAGASKIVNAFEEFGNNCTVKDGATGGSSILKTVNNTNHWVNDDTPGSFARGPAYTTFLNSLTTGERAQNNIIAFWAQTTADADALNAGTITKAEQKAGLEQVIDWVHEDIPDLVAFVINLAHAHNVKPDAGWQLSRGIQLEVIAEGKAQRGVEFYDLDQIDGVHLTQAGYEEFGRRIGRRAAQIAGYSLAGAQGPAVTGVEINTDELLVYLAHDEGTDIATPLSLTTSRERVENDGSLITVSSIERVNETTLKYTLASTPLFGTDLKFYPVWGSLNLGGTTNKNVIKDNATNPLPLQSGVYSAAYTDPLVGLDNVRHDIDAKGSPKTYSSGAVVNEITALSGGNMIETSSGKGPTFASDKLIFNSDNQLISKGIDAATPTQSLILCGTMPDPIPANANVMIYANNSGTSATFNARIFINDSKIRWQRNEAAGVEDLTGTLSAGDPFCFTLVFTDETTANVYRAQDIAGGSVSAFNTFDPRINYSTVGQKVILGQDHAQPLDADFSLYRFVWTDDVLSNTEIVNAMSYLVDRFDMDMP